MRTIRFTRDTVPHREGGPGFKAGEVHDLNDASARRWVVRNAAEYHSRPEPVVAEAPAGSGKGRGAKGAKVSDQEKKEAVDGNTVGSTEAVAGADGGNPGDGKEPDAGDGGVGAVGAAADDSGK